MQLLRRYIILTLTLLITLSASGVNVSVHRCCGKIKNFALLGDSKVCNMSKHSTSFSGKHSAHSAVNGIPCCNNQNIRLHNQVQAAQQKAQSVEKHVQPFLFSFELLKSWFSTEELPAVKITPFITKHLREPLTILLRQFRI